MGWYSAVGRPLFFALPPETAHRVAGVTLALPLPWRRIGGAVDDPRLEASLAGIPLRNPIGLAAGFDKTCAHLDALGELGFGYVVGGTVTRAPRDGNARPRIVRYPSKDSMANAMGLPNPGAEVAAVHLANVRRSSTPRVVSLADEAVEDALAAFEQVEPLVDAVELNASCPNVSWGRDRDNEAHLRDLVAGMRARSDGPLFVKLPPFTAPVERDVVLALARIAQEAGASGITCSNTRLVGDPRLSVGTAVFGPIALGADRPDRGGRPRRDRGSDGDQRVRRRVDGGRRRGVLGGGREHRADLFRAHLPGPRGHRSALSGNGSEAAGTRSVGHRPQGRPSRRRDPLGTPRAVGRLAS